MFVRKKRNSRSGSDYHQVVQSRRVDGQPRQKVVMHLGGNLTVDDGLKPWPRDISDLRCRGYAAAADKLKAQLDGLRGLRDDGTV